jgi:hypothetical protein
MDYNAMYDEMQHKLPGWRDEAQMTGEENAAVYFRHYEETCWHAIPGPKVEKIFCFA